MENILDVSAILALLLKEDGYLQVIEALTSGSGASTVNMSEVMARCIRVGMPNDAARRLIEPLPVIWIELDAELAYRAGELIAVTQHFGLSLGDRCCLALALRENVPVVTADRTWSKLSPLLNMTVKTIR